MCLHAFAYVFVYFQGILVKVEVVLLLWRVSEKHSLNIIATFLSHNSVQVDSRSMEIGHYYSLELLIPKG